MAISTLKTILNLYVILWIVHNPGDSLSMPFTVLMLSGEGSLPQAQKPCSYSERDLNEFEVGPSFKAFSTKEGRCFRFGAKTHEVPQLCEEGSPKMPLQCARVIGPNRDCAHKQAKHAHHYHHHGIAVTCHYDLIFKEGEGARGHNPKPKSTFKRAELVPCCPDPFYLTTLVQTLIMHTSSQSVPIIMTTTILQSHATMI
ncbi:unnamed protein product [Prunus armeniaca]